MQCAAAYSLMESTIYSTYEQTNTVMEGKLQELLQVIERISASMRIIQAAFIFIILSPSQICWSLS